MAAPAFPDQPSGFDKNPRQIEAQHLLTENTHTLLYGGSRSGKTFLIVRQIVLRAMKFKSRHLIYRLRYNHCKISILNDTFPKVMSLCFPDVPFRVNKSDAVVYIPTYDGKESEIWFAGSDDPARVERVLGNEYSTIFANEISQIAWDVNLVMWTRLAENSGLKLRAYYDCNPPTTRHWAHTLFFDGKSPKGEPIEMPLDPYDPDSPKEPVSTSKLLMNPTDNPHLPSAYMGILHTLPERQRRRFLYGEFVSDVEGALWNFDMLAQARILSTSSPLREVIVSVDPSVKDDEGDECGIIVCGRDEEDHGRVIEDVTGQLTTNDWARRVVSAYHRHSANYVVAEVNNGGDLVVNAIRAIPGGNAIPIRKVHAKQGKYARAEPVAQLYEQHRIAHEGDFHQLEEELTTYVPRDATHSPNRLDALVHGITHLMVGGVDTFDIG